MGSLPILEEESAMYLSYGKGSYSHFSLCIPLQAGKKNETGLQEKVAYKNPINFELINISSI